MVIWAENGTRHLTVGQYSFLYTVMPIGLWCGYVGSCWHIQSPLSSQGRISCFGKLPRYLFSSFLLHVPPTREIYWDRKTIPNGEHIWVGAICLNKNFLTFFIGVFRTVFFSTDILLIIRKCCHQVGGTAFILAFWLWRGFAHV